MAYIKDEIYLEFEDAEVNICRLEFQDSELVNYEGKRPNINIELDSISNNFTPDEVIEFAEKLKAYAEEMKDKPYQYSAL